MQTHETAAVDTISQCDKPREKYVRQAVAMDAPLFASFFMCRTGQW